MSLDQLPLELVVKIFRYLLDDWKNIERLRRTCRRFNDIVNNHLITIHDEQLPEIRPGPLHGKCHHGYTSAVGCLHCFIGSLEGNRVCSTCRGIKTGAKNKMIVFRELKLDYFHVCCPRTISEEATTMGKITELYISYHLGEVNLLSHVLSKLPNVRRLSWKLRGPSEHDIFDTYSTSTETPTRRTLTSLKLDGTFSRSQYDYVLEFLPAEKLEIVIRVNYARFWDKSWLESYVAKHKSTLKQCTLLLERDRGQNNRQFNQRLRSAATFVLECNFFLERQGYRSREGLHTGWTAARIIYLINRLQQDRSGRLGVLTINRIVELIQREFGLQRYDFASNH